MRALCIFADCVWSVRLILKKFAFSLAEVLVTLTVIGVLAAFTIPTVLQNMEDAQYKTAAKAAYSKISQAVTNMVKEEGTLSQYIGNNASFKQQFIKYFNVSKDCNMNDCVPEEDLSNIYKTIGNNPANTNGMGGEGQFVTNDGMFFNIQNTVSHDGHIIIVVDVNGYEKKPNVYGRDTFAFEIYNDKVLPMGASGTRLGESSVCNRTATDALQGLGCTVKAIRGENY